jgi:hypothetical protein
VISVFGNLVFNAVLLSDRDAISLTLLRFSMPTRLPHHSDSV